jgi:hypothetical protein
MFRVPTDPTRPSFDHTTKVGFFRWLRSSKADRVEWQRRRDAAAELARQGQNARAQQRSAAWVTKRERKRHREE